MPANDIASSTTIIQAASPSAPGFGVPIIAQLLSAPQDALWGVNLIREFTQSSWIADLTALGFVDGDALWEEFQIGFSADVVPPKVLVGKQASPQVAQIQPFSLTVGVLPDGPYTITVNGEDFTHTAVGGAETGTGIRDALVALFPGSQPVTTAPVATEDGTITASVAGIPFATAVASPAGDLTLGTITASVGLTTDIVAWEEERSDWYFVTDLSRSVAVNVSMADGPVDSFTRAIVFNSQVSSATDPNALDGTSSTRAAGQNTTSQRCAVSYVPSATKHALAAHYFRLLPEDPGSITWANWGLKAFEGDRYSNPNTSALTGQGTDPGDYWYYEAIPTISTLPISRGARMRDQTPFDLVRGRDWIDAEIETQVGQAIVAEPKIPYTDTGSQVIIATIGGVLGTAVNRGIIVEGFAVTTTIRADQIPADIAARKWRGFAWTATLAGAIESVDISGVLFIV